jgi:hypothetical protein
MNNYNIYVIEIDCNGRGYPYSGHPPTHHQPHILAAYHEKTMGTHSSLNNCQQVNKQSKLYYNTKNDFYTPVLQRNQHIVYGHIGKKDVLIII